MKEIRYRGFTPGREQACVTKSRLGVGRGVWNTVDVGSHLAHTVGLVRRQKEAIATSVATWLDNTSEPTVVLVEPGTRASMISGGMTSRSSRHRSR